MDGLAGPVETSGQGVQGIRGTSFSQPGGGLRGMGYDGCEGFDD